MEGDQWVGDFLDETEADTVFHIDPDPVRGIPLIITDSSQNIIKDGIARDREGGFLHSGETLHVYGPRYSLDEGVAQVRVRVTKRLK